MATKALSKGYFHFYKHSMYGQSAITKFFSVYE